MAIDAALTAMVFQKAPPPPLRHPPLVFVRLIDAVHGEWANFRLRLSSAAPVCSPLDGAHCLFSRVEVHAWFEEHQAFRPILDVCQMVEQLTLTDASASAVVAMADCWVAPPFVPFEEVAALPPRLAELAGPTRGRLRMRERRIEESVAFVRARVIAGDPLRLAGDEDCQPIIAFDAKELEPV